MDTVEDYETIMEKYEQAKEHVAELTKALNDEKAENSRLRAELSLARQGHGIQGSVNK